MKLPSRLLVFDYVSVLLGGASGDRPDIGRVLRRSAHIVERGRRSDGQSHYMSLFESWGTRVKVDQARLAEYDMNVLRLEDRLAASRPDFRFTYFQYLALLYSELYLDRLSADPQQLLRELREHRARFFQQRVSPVSRADLNKAAFWMATGSGKTLLAHANYWQFQTYRPFDPDNIVFLAPSPTLANQHLRELHLSGIEARHALRVGHPSDVQVLEITKLYVDSKDIQTPHGGDSLATSTFDGRNLVFVDEGHKGSTTKRDKIDERKWRDIREALAGANGFTFEYSATFGQIADKNNELLDEYGKAILFDYGYKHFWRDGYGKDYRVVNLKSEGAFDADELLLAGLLVLYEQMCIWVDHRDDMAQYNIEPPLMIFLGATVTGAVESEVLQIVKFLDRVLSDEEWSTKCLSQLLTGTAGLPRDLFSHDFPYLTTLEWSTQETYNDFCYRLFHGTGRLVMHLLAHADGEIGLRSADASQDAYCGVINVGSAARFARKAELAGVARGEDDHITDSLFDLVDRKGSMVNLLIGSRKFIEGWSSWRVSVMGLLKVGKSAGPQVIQLFGRGVRLKGRDLGLRRSSHLPGSHPRFLYLLETIHIFGLKANYMEAFNEAVRREGVPPPVMKTLPIKLRSDIRELDLKIPDRGDYSFFDEEVETFTVEANMPPVEIDLRPTFSTAQGIEKPVTSHGAFDVETVPFPVHLIDIETAYFDLLAFKRRRGWHNIYVPRLSVATFLGKKVTVTAPKGSLAAASERVRHLAKVVGRDALHRGLERFVYTCQHRRETRRLSVSSIDADHLNFPRMTEGGKTTLGYRLEVPASIEKEVDSLLKKLDAREVPLENLAEPLPRLHLDAHLYTPILLKETNVSQGGYFKLGFFESPVRAIPAGLVESEILFLRHLRDCWNEISVKPFWEGYELYILRNLPKRGVGFFRTAGFYPDFMLWLRRGDAQGLAFVEPHGMVIWDPMKVSLLDDIRHLGLSVPMTAWIVTKTPPRSIGAIGGAAATEDWLRDRYILFQGNDTYVNEILVDLRRAVDGFMSEQDAKGDLPLQRGIRTRILGDEEVSDIERFARYLPLYSLRAAAGLFGRGEVVDREGWVQVEGRLSHRMFVARAVGKSMEPTICDGDLCVFRRYRGGTRQGKIVLVRWMGLVDEDTGASYAVKQYHREGARGSKHMAIELRSFNPKYSPITFLADQEEEVAVIAEFITVLRSPLSSQRSS